MHELIDVARASASAIRRHAFALLIITALTEAVVAVASGFWRPMVEALPLSGLGPLEGPLRGVLGLAAVSVITPIGKAATAVLIHRGDRGLLAALAALGVIANILPLIIVAAALWYLATLVGLALLVVPGVLVFFGSQFAIQALAVERIAIRAAFRRSFALVARGPAAVVVLFVTLEVGQGVLTGLLEAATGPVTPPSFISVRDWLISAVMAVIVYVPLAVMFIQRMRRFDASISRA